MNCDDVFDALTDPAQSHSSQPGSAQLAAHLASCPRCRQMQQVLEPALSLLCGDLPAERVPGVEDATDAQRDPRPVRSTPFLSVESVGVAEAIAAQLTATAHGRSVRPSRWSVDRRLLATTLRSAALVLFGALAVYCIGGRGRTSDGDALPAVVPATRPTAACTRLDLQRKDRGNQDARRVVLSCVACHMKADPTPNKPVSTTLGWPFRNRTPGISLAVSNRGASWVKFQNCQASC